VNGEQTLDFTPKEVRIVAFPAEVVVRFHL
jgi:hypothetical protein